ncbi:MAG: hypothetical protein ACREC6_05745 [Hyphomicrobiaceae bacterium]
MPDPKILARRNPVLGLCCQAVSAPAQSAATFADPAVSQPKPQGRPNRQGSSRLPE